MKGDRHGGYHVRHRDADPGGAGSSGDSLGPRQLDPTLPHWAQIAAGGVRPSLAQLREAAELARAREPKSARRAILSLGLVTGQPWGDVASLTIGDMEYVVKQLRDTHGRR